MYRVLILLISLFYIQSGAAEVDAKHDLLTINPEFRSLFIEKSSSRWGSQPDSLEDFLYAGVKRKLKGSELLRYASDKTGLAVSEVGILYSLYLRASAAEADFYKGEEHSRLLYLQLQKAIMQAIKLTGLSYGSAHLVLNLWNQYESCLSTELLQAVKQRSDAVQLIIDYPTTEFCPEHFAGVVEKVGFHPALQFYVVDNSLLSTAQHFALLKQLLEQPNIKAQPELYDYLYLSLLQGTHEHGMHLTYRDLINAMSEQQKLAYMRGVKFDASFTLSGVNITPETDYYHFLYEEVAHLLLLGNKATARKTFDTHFNAEMHDDEVLNEVISHLLSNKPVDVFRAFIYTGEMKSFGLDGWYWSLLREPPGLKALGAKLSIKNQNMDIAEALMRTFDVYSANDKTNQWDTVLAEFFNAQDIQAQQIAYAEEALTTRDELVKSLGLSLLEDVAQQVVSEGSLVFQERNYKQLLTANGEEAKKSWSPDEQQIRDMNLPVIPYSIVRVSAEGNRVFVVYQSQDIDPVGEVSAGGYWVIRSDNKGISWSDPFYLGLLAHQPYVVMEDSSIPMADGEHLNIHVQRAELDESSITFPPIALQIKGDIQDLVLRFAWQDIVRDTDGDGLTDLMEEKLLLDPRVADTDKDGTSDGLDPLPNVAFSGSQSLRAELMEIVIDNTLGYEQQGIIPGIGSSEIQLLNVERPVLERNYTMFIAGDPSDFAGLNLPVRAIVLNQQQLSAIQKERGVFYPMDIQLFINQDQSEAFVSWNARWTGGNISLTKTLTGWIVADASTWIT